MSWKPQFGWPGNRTKASASAKTEDDETPEGEDDVLPIEDDEEEEETPEADPAPKTEDAPPADDPQALAAENARLKAENQRLTAQMGEKPLADARKEANASAVRLFGKETQGLKQAKTLIAQAETPAEATRLKASFDLAFAQTEIAAKAGQRQTNRPAPMDPESDAAARASAAVARTRPRASK